MTQTLLTSVRFSLSRADALAWEILPREMTGARRFTFFVWLGSAGMWLLALPEAWLSQSWTVVALLPFVAVHWAVAAVVMTLSARIKARARIPAPVGAEVQDLGDRLLWQQGTGPALTIRPAAIRQVLWDARHVFIEAPPEVLIMPVAAFDSPAAAQAFAARWEELSRNAVP